MLAITVSDLRDVVYVFGAIMSQPSIGHTPPPVEINYGKDVFAGFLVFLIALPLCLGISLASGCPAVAGVFTAIVGSLICALISNSELTIKGPAAGLIAIVLGAITEFKDLGFGDYEAYRMMLAVGLAAGVLQILFGLLKIGILGEFFPLAAVHGLLAAIGVIIISKQIHVALGVMDLKGGPFQLLAQIPHSFQSMNPEIAMIGGISLLILFGMPFIKNPMTKRIPAQLIVIAMAISLGLWLHISQEHTYIYSGKSFTLNDKFLVSVPKSLASAITTPDFSALKQWESWKWVFMFALIGSLESLISAKAVDLLDPLKRKTNMDRDLLAVGIANTVVAGIGGLPMISEIVRSKANIDNGARTRVSGVCHGLCLLAFVALLPGLIHQIPLAALAAMLVFTGLRLASYTEFAHMQHIGTDQLIVFLSTLIGVLATDLLIGIAIGIAVELCIHWYRGVPIGSLFSSKYEIEYQPDGKAVIHVDRSAVFSNWIALRKKIVHYGVSLKKPVIVDLSKTRLVDHTVMNKLQALQRDFTEAGLSLEIQGLESHVPLSNHELAVRLRPIE